MENFITGYLEKNEENTLHRGVIWTRWLTLRLSGGRTLPIFDMNAISANLPVHRSYSVVVMATYPKGLRYFPTVPRDIKPGVWHGIVLDPAWQTHSIGFRRARHTIDDLEAVLVETSCGCLLMDAADLGGPVQAGGFIQWDASDFDLCAIC